MSEDGKPEPRELTGKEIAAKLAALDKPRGSLVGGGANITPEQIDDVTRAELERWFGLPSYAQVEAGEVAPTPAGKPEDPEVAAVRERRERAIAAVEPAMLDAIAARAARRSAPFKERPEVIVHVREDVAIADLAAIERAHLIAEPREVELPPEMQDDLKECVPQALLRDLHRAVLSFDKTFDVVDMAAEQTLDIVAMVNEAIRTSWHLTAADVSGMPKDEAIAIIETLRAERRTPWAALWTAKPLPNRKVTE